MQQGYRLSPQQKRLWLLQRQEDASAAYCAQCAIEIEGVWRPEVLREALARVVRRHEILRTSFERRAGLKVPLQVVNDAGQVSWREAELPGTEAGEQRHQQIDQICAEERRALTSEEQKQTGVLRATLWRGQRELLVLTAPGLCADAATMRKLAEEVSRAYAACENNRESPDEAVQYADISEVLNELLEAEDTETGREYWRKQDLSVKQTLSLPFEKRLSENRGFDSSCLSMAIAPGVAAKVEALAAQHRMSVEAILLACWQALLRRLTGQSEMLIGVAYDGRTYEDAEEVLGLIAKYLPLRFHLEEDFKFLNVLKATHKLTEEVAEWQDYFSWEQSGLTGESDLEFLPVGFDFEGKAARYSDGRASLSVVGQYTCIERFNLRLSVTRQSDLSITQFYYDANLFSTADVRQLAERYHRLLESAVSNPEATIGSLEILGDEERQRLLVDFNATAADFPRDSCIHELFEQQAAHTPDSPAVVFENRQLSYRELNGRANQVAHFLRKRRVGADVLVGLYVERSIEMIVGLLGIIKAGGAYVPLDPDSPKARLNHQITDIKAPVLLTQEKLLDGLPDYDGEILCLDRDQAILESEPETDPRNITLPEHLVYVIYTSGSTGVPKGVAVTHQSLVNYTHFIKGKIQSKESAGDTGLQFATVSTISADLGNTSIFPSLVSGGCLHILGYEVATDGGLLSEYVSRHRIDVLKIVPSHLTALLASRQPRELLPRKYLFLGGEAFSFDLFKRLSEASTECEIFNHYGPTETTIGSLTFSVKDNQDLLRQSTVLPIGRPIANTEVYILDTHLKPVPVRVPGELYIGGSGLSRGYVNQPGQTAERFIPHPFSRVHGSRLYKTGDLARYLPDGNVEFLGRVDHQVKIHGFRIELGEIEAALGRHPAVRETAVLAVEETNGDKRLVAYVVPDSEAALKSAELRRFLKDELPEYMMPSAFVILKALPLTPNGKLDRRALPVPDRSRSDLEEGRVAPRNTTEETLERIWAKVLGIEQVGVHDNFFELGGDSILSIQIAARAAQAGLRFTPMQLFRNPTIAELAGEVGAVQPASNEEGAATGVAPLTPSQHQFFARHGHAAHNFTQTMTLEVFPALDASLLEAAIKQLTVQHDALRLLFTRENSVWKQIYASPEETVPFSAIDLSALPESEKASALEAGTAALQTGFNLTEGPLMRAGLFQLGGQQPDRLVIVIHQLLADDASWRILLEDLQTACEQLGRGESVRLPPRTTSLKHWAERLNESAQAITVQSEEADPHAEQPQGLGQLALDYTDGENSAASASSLKVSLNAEETAAFLQEIPKAYRTQPEDALLTALACAFSRLIGIQSFLIDVTGDGREKVFEGMNLSRTIGRFDFSFPALLNPVEVDEPGSALKLIKEQLRSVPDERIWQRLLLQAKAGEETLERPESIRHAAVSFKYENHSGRLLPEPGLFKPVQGLNATTQSSQAIRPYVLEIEASVNGGELHVNWTYSENLHRRATIERLADGFMKELRALISHCQSADAGGYTPSDFRRVKLDQQTLDKILRKSAKQMSN